MPYISLFFLIFGSIIIVYPELIAYIIGFVCIFIGLNSLLLNLVLRRKMSNQSKPSWSFGGYEIIRKNK